MRDPLQDLREFIIGTEKKSPPPTSPDDSLMHLTGPLESSSITAANFIDYSDLFLLIDMLVRFAYLNSNPELYSKQLDALNIQAREEFSIMNVGKLFRTAEVACVIQRKYHRDQIGKSGHTLDPASKENTAMMLQLQDKFKGNEVLAMGHYNYKKMLIKQKGQKVLQLLCANLATFEKELDNQLGYRIADGDGESVHAKEAALIAAFKLEDAWDRYTSFSFIVKSTITTLAVGTAIYLFNSIFTSNN